MLVFVRTKVRAERVAKAMERADIDTLTMHSDKVHQERINVLEQFKQGKTKVLIATDINARGIDIPNVDMVINYDLPDEAENYVHRVGRTGRGTKKGQAISFCSKEEQATLKKIETFLHQPVTILDLEKEDYLETISFAKETLANENLSDLLKEVELFEKSKVKKKKK